MGILKTLGFVEDAPGNKPPPGKVPAGKDPADLSDEEVEAILAEEAKKKGGKASAQATGLPAGKAQPPPPPALAQNQPRTPRPTLDPADFQDIYALAAIKVPPHGYTAEKVNTMLANPRFANMAPEVRAAAVLASLEAQGIPLGDVVTDAETRANTLEGYETWLVGQHAAADRAAQEEATRLQRELDQVVAQVRAQLEASQAGVTTRAQALTEWRRKKQVELQRLHDVASMIAPTHSIPKPVTETNPFFQGAVGGQNPFYNPINGK
jgi:hypothetical protein